MKSLLCSILAPGVVLCGPLVASAQDNVPPTITSVTWEISRNLDGDPSIDGTFDQFEAFDPVLDRARELDILRFTITITDPDLPDEDIYIARNAFWVPLRGYLTPEPPPMVEDDPEFQGPFSIEFGSTIVLVGELSIPSFIGKSQARLRGLIDWDVRWLNQFMASNEESPDEIFPGITIACGLTVNGVHFWCDNLHALENPAVSPPNPPPFANAGRDLVVAAGTTVELDGSETFDGFNIGFNVNSIDIFEKDRIEFVWEWTSGPERVDPIFRDPVNAPAVAEVTLNELGTYRFRLIADDGVNALPTTDSMVIEVVASIPENRAPIAVATGPTQAILVGSVVTLDGTTSFDPDGDPLGFLWQQTDELGGLIPASEIGRFFQPMSGIDSPVSRWQTTKPGIFHFRLLVNDGEFVDSTRISIEVTETATAGFVVVQPGAALPNSAGESTDSTPTPPEPGNQSLAPLCGGGLFPVLLAPFAMFLMRGPRRR